MSTNNIFSIITHDINQGATFMCMADLETDLFEPIEHHVAWPRLTYCSRQIMVGKAVECRSRSWTGCRQVWW